LEYGANPNIVKTVYTFKLGQIREPGFADLILMSTTYE
jgi:hypothetical protein